MTKRPTLSMFDQQLFQFACECGERTEIVVSQLDNRTSFTCPACGRVTDLRSEPYRSMIEDLREIASEHDKQARERGEVIQRIT